ncbi:hypothetical protein, partial [Micrococcus luteus]|uniref:hypothetical protein n=1 Tax=Micrococcus luteus TaxID=1270 RepID=UPI001C92C762
LRGRFGLGQAQQWCDGEMGGVVEVGSRREGEEGEWVWGVFVMEGEELGVDEIVEEGKWVVWE